MLSFDLREKPIDRSKPSSGFDLGEDDAVETGPNDRHQIAIAKLGVDRIDANIEELRRGCASAVTIASRVARFSATATASSRSRMTASASSDSAFSTRLA